MQGKISTYNIDVLKNTLDTEIREFINTGETYDYMPMPTITLGTVEAQMFINGTYNITWSATPSDAYKYISLYFLKTPNEVTTYENLITAYLPIEKNVYSWKVPYDFVPGSYYIKLVSSYQNVEITDITPTAINIISAKVPKFKVIQPTGPTIPLRDNIQLMYTISDNQYGHLNQFSLYYVDKNAPNTIVDLNTTVQVSTGDYEDVVYFSIPWGVDDFRLIVSASSILDNRDLSIYIPSVSNSSSSLFMHIDEPSILVYTSIGTNYTVTQNSAFSINWTAKKGLDGLGNLVDVFYASDRKKGQWELLFKDYPMSLNATGNGYVGNVSNVKIPLTYVDDTTTIKIDWVNSKTGQKYEFKKDVTVNKAQDTVIVSEFVLKHGNTIIQNGNTLLVNDKLPISVSFDISNVDRQIEPGTIKVTYTVSNSPDIDVKLLDVEYNENSYAYEGMLSEENVAKLGNIISSKIKIKYYNRIFEKENDVVMIPSLNFKVKELRKHEIKNVYIKNYSNGVELSKSNTLFYDRQYDLYYTAIGNNFYKDEIKWKITESGDIDDVDVVASGIISSKDTKMNFKFISNNRLVGSNKIHFSGYNVWNKDDVRYSHPIQLATRSAHITNKSSIENKTFYNIHHIDDDTYTTIDVNISANLPTYESASVYLVSASYEHKFDVSINNLNYKLRLNKNSDIPTGDYIIKLMILDDNTNSQIVADQVFIKIHEIKILNVDFKQSSYDYLYKLYNTPYFYINDVILYLNKLIENNEIKAIDGISTVGGIKQDIEEFSTQWEVYKNDIYHLDEYSENARLSRISKYKLSNKVFTNSKAKAKDEMIPILKKVLDRRKYYISNIDIRNILFSIANSFNRYEKMQDDCRKRQIAIDDIIIKNFINQLKILYAVFNKEPILRLIRTGTIGDFASISSRQQEYIFKLYNISEYYGHITDYTLLDPNRFTSDYMYIKDILNTDDFKSVLAIIFAFLYFFNATNSTDVFNPNDAKNLNFNLLVNRDMLLSINNNSLTYHDMLCQLYIIFPSILKNANVIINKWNMVIPSRNSNGERGILLKSNVMTDLQATFNTIDTFLKTNKTPRDIHYPFEYYLKYFYNTHESNNLYVGDGVKMAISTSNLLKLDSLKFKLGLENQFKSKIQLNEYTNNDILINSTVLYDDLVLYDGIEKYIFIDDSIVTMPENRYSISIHETVSNDVLKLYETKKLNISYFIENPDSPIRVDDILYNYPSQSVVQYQPGQHNVINRLTMHVLNLTNSGGNVIMSADVAGTIDIVIEEIDNDDGSIYEYMLQSGIFIGTQQSTIQINSLQMYYPDEKTYSYLFMNSDGLVLQKYGVA